VATIRLDHPTFIADWRAMGSVCPPKGKLMPTELLEAQNAELRSKIRRRMVDLGYRILSDDEIDQAVMNIHRLITNPIFTVVK
jgi:hypothetical protein